MDLKKAAMFGLDARIALAIFGALSVISGAALYSAIQQAKVISFIAHVNEMHKAIEAYMLDMGENLPVQASPTDYIVNTNSFVVSTGPSWNGPYFDLTPDTGGNGFVNGFITNAWGSIDRWNISHATYYPEGANVCITGPNCYYGVRHSGHTIDMAKAVDEYIDGGDGATTGKVRYWGSATYDIEVVGPRAL